MKEQQKKSPQPYADSITAEGDNLTITGDSELTVVVEIKVTDAQGNITILRKCWDGQAWADC
jgi:hypothetical protein